MNDIEAFFQEIDRLWEPVPAKRIPLRVIGSGALFLQTDYRRATKDGDVLETLHINAELKQKLTALAGKRTDLHRRTGLYLDIVMPGLPFLPHGPIFRAQKDLNEGLRSFSIEALDVTDVVVSKLKRFNPNDAGDVRAMIDMGFIKHGRLIERFNAAVDGFSLDSRAEDIPRIVDNLHRVERDMFRVPERVIGPWKDLRDGVQLDSRDNLCWNLIYFTCPGAGRPRNAFHFEPETRNVRPEPPKGGFVFPAALLRAAEEEIPQDYCRAF